MGVTRKDWPKDSTIKMGDSNGDLEGHFNFSSRAACKSVQPTFKIILCIDTPKVFVHEIYPDRQQQLFYSNYRPNGAFQEMSPTSSVKRNLQGCRRRYICVNGKLVELEGTFKILLKFISYLLQALCEAIFYSRKKNLFKFIYM